MVAVLLILVATVLMPAAKMAAMSKPVKPTGSPFTIKCGKTLSPAPAAFNSAGRRSG